jgi:osmoprotectant transport system substrate-binding protein
LVIWRKRRGGWAVLAGMAMLLAGCGTTSASQATPLPGHGKPTIMLGDAGSNEELLLGELYAQAFRAVGYIVVLTPITSTTQQMDAAFQSGQINAYPEYLGDLAAIDAGHTTPLASEAEAEQVAQGYEQKHGATVMLPATPFSNAGALVALASFARSRSLTTIAQLNSLPFRLKFGDDASGETRYAGFAGLKQAYGLTNLQFVALPTGKPIYDALDNHLVQVGDAFSTDPQLAGPTYAILSDPKNVFGFQHVALIIKTTLLSRLGAAFQQAYATVNKLLTTAAMRALNKAVSIDGQPPASVAHSFLLANRVLSD